MSYRLQVPNYLTLSLWTESQRLLVTLSNSTTNTAIRRNSSNGHRHLISKSAFMQFYHFDILYIWKKESRAIWNCKGRGNFCKIKGVIAPLKSGTGAKNAVAVWTTSSFVDNKRCVIWVIALDTMAMRGYIDMGISSLHKKFRSRYRMHAFHNKWHSM